MTTSEPHAATIRQRDQMLQDRSGDSFLDRYEAAVLAQMYDALLPPEFRINPARLIVAIDGSNLAANVVGSVTTAVQKATAKLVESRATRAPVTTATAGAKQRAQLRLVSAGAGRLVFNMAAPPPHPGQLLQPVDTTQAELGLVDLCETLPEQPSIDDRAVDNLLGASLTVRSAVRDIIQAPITERTLRFQLITTRGTELESVLSPDQTRFLRKELRVDPDEQVSADSITGYLDAAREVRRVFYLEAGHRGPIEGSIEPTLVERVRGLAGEVVRIGVDVTRRPGRPNRYNLVSIEPTLGRRDDFINE